jgi:hypothetical protein
MSPTLQNNNVWRLKKFFQPTIVVLHLSFLGFERTFYYVLNWHIFIFWTIYQKLATQQQMSERISLLLLLRHYKRSVSKASQRTFGLSIGVLFASNDSKTSFEQRKSWTDNWDDSLKTNMWPQQTIFRTQQSNFVCSNNKFVGDMAWAIDYLQNSFGHNLAKSPTEHGYSGPRDEYFSRDPGIPSTRREKELRRTCKKTTTSQHCHTCISHLLEIKLQQLLYIAL